MAVTSLRPPDGPDVAYEFYSPFAHVPGKYEWCRIRSPTHGVFDVFILLSAGPSEPATVYVNDDAGLGFMQERYPECLTIRVPPDALAIEEGGDGRTVRGELAGAPGRLRTARMTISAEGGVAPRAVPYGGEGRPVWGSRRWTCWGVDLVLDARVLGEIMWTDPTRVERLDAYAIVTLGSFGRISRFARP